MSNSTGNDLMEFVSSFGGGDGLRVEETLGNGYVRLRIAEAERRQALHDIRSVEDAVIELLRNSRDADAQRIFVASSRELNIRTITIIDDGAGIPPEMHRRVFDARVTSKLDTVHMDKWGIHGRGMALYSIRHNALSAHVVNSNIGLGTSIQATFNVDDVNERADQSTWPVITQGKHSAEVRGPRNIARACVEFALESKGSCNVYLGSPSEILATIRRRIDPYSTNAVMPEQASSTPLVLRPSLAQDARQLSEAAHALGLEMSERTAHRIIRGQIGPLRNVLSTSNGLQTSSSKSIVGDRRRLLLSESDKAELVDAIAKNFSHVVSKYYLRLEGTPRIRVDGKSVHITLEYGEQDE